MTDTNSSGLEYLTGMGTDADPRSRGMVLNLHFKRPVTPADRDAILAALNAAASTPIVLPVDPDATTPAQILAAASAATSAVTDLIEIARYDSADIGGAMRHREAAENLADALQTVLTARMEGAADSPEREMDGDLLAAVGRFLEGWA